MTFVPKLPGDLERLDPNVVPPGRLVATVVEVSMVFPAEGHREVVPHLSPHRPRLSEPKVMGVGRRGTAQEAGLGAYKPEVLLVAKAPGFVEMEHALVDVAYGGR